MTDLELRGVTKVYDDAQGTETAVDALDLTVEDGEFVVLVGPSGCGKSTTLRMIAGLETVSSGTIAIDGEAVQQLAPSARSVAMVFQSYALYSKMTAHQNMAYGLKHAGGLPKRERDERVEEIAELLDITELLADRPDEMSGGQKQRVALGRAIVRDPKVFLLDEPLSNLDAKLRARMRTELQRIQDDLGVTTVYVTHDQTEAMTMADRIAILRDGELQQVAPPQEAYDHPANEFVATFLGSPAMNTFDVTARTGDDAIRFERDETVFASVPTAAVDLADGEAIRFGVRPEDLDLAGGADVDFEAAVTVTEYQGNDNFVHLDASGVELTARVPPYVHPDRDETVGVSIDADDVYLFDLETGETTKSRGRSPASTQPERRANLE